MEQDMVFIIVNKETFNYVDKLMENLFSESGYENDIMNNLFEIAPEEESTVPQEFNKYILSESKARKSRRRFIFVANNSLSLLNWTDYNEELGY